MNLARTHTELGWPTPEKISSPTGAGPRVFAELAAARIGRNLRSTFGANSQDAVTTGVLFPDSSADRTETPVAVVCDFLTHASKAALLEAHRLAWNFSHAPLLITIEPTRVLAWSCCVPPGAEDPNDGETFGGRVIASFPLRDRAARNSTLGQVEEAALSSLHWINLLAGQHFAQNPKMFQPEGRLDWVLLNNLLAVRDELTKSMGMPEDTCHDLLARLIFIQFLFQRKDSAGRPALHAEKLRQLAADGVLQEQHPTFESLLEHYEDTYAFFLWLNDRFNGDLFPGKADSEEDRAREWEAEKKLVQPEHLKKLASFISGKEDVSSRQQFLWSQYSFDAIPLELVSSIYEIFVGPPEKDKAYYTKGHLVDFMLDAVLPWEGDCAPLRILDPSCGSGIFLVKSFQRLIHRWKNRNGNDPKPTDLRDILQKQLFGVDINPHAVRVASFSLYLAMCDALDPKHYWNSRRIFPPLRGANLIASDFFREGQSPFCTASDAATFDLVIGNAPWGKSSADNGRSGAQEWARAHGWTAPGKDHGPVFLAKAARLAKPDGRVSMIQPGGLLLNGTRPTREFRKKLFHNFRFQEVINLSAIRRELFSAAIGPACIVTFQPKSTRPTTELAYVVPKPLGTPEDRLRTVIASHDIHFVQHEEAAIDPLVWTALMWGGRRDLELIRRLSKRRSLDDLKKAGLLVAKEGLIRGKKDHVEHPEIVGRKILSSPRFPEGILLRLEAEALDTNDNPLVHRRQELSAFDPPQLIFKQSWRAGLNRLQAVLVEPDEQGRGALCSDSYVSVRALNGDENALAGLWLLLNSRFAPYWFALSAGQFSGFIPKATETELRRMPVIAFNAAELPGIVKAGYKAIDDKVETLLGISRAEKILIQDLHEIVFPDAQRISGDPPGHHSVKPAELISYCETFCQSLKATFGADKRVCATIFEATDERNATVQLVAIHLDWARDQTIAHHQIASPELIALLGRCYESIMRPADSGVTFQRVIEAIQSFDSEDGPVPTLYLVRPRQRRYWTRSLALSTADGLSSAIASFGLSRENDGKRPAARST